MGQTNEKTYLEEMAGDQFQKGFVVFEGLDQSGKSLQTVRVAEKLWPKEIYLGHQPSTPLETMGFQTDGEWKTLKKQWATLTPLARWLLHAASHAQHYVELESLFMERKPVLLDRFWWSAYAYNFCADDLTNSGITKEQFLSLELVATRSYSPELIIFFDGTVTKLLNTGYIQRLDSAYRELLHITQEYMPDRLRIVDVWPGRSEDEIHMQVMSFLSEINFGRE